MSVKCQEDLAASRMGTCGDRRAKKGNWRPMCGGSTPVRWLAQYDLRTARRVWRMVVLATQRPATMVLPAPQPAATCVIMPSG
jgi:hypothetical protein